MQRLQSASGGRAESLDTGLSMSELNSDAASLADNPHPARGSRQRHYNEPIRPISFVLDKPLCVISLHRRAGDSLICAARPAHAADGDQCSVAPFLRGRTCNESLLYAHRSGLGRARHESADCRLHVRRPRGIPGR